MYDVVSAFVRRPVLSCSQTRLYLFFINLYLFNSYYISLLSPRSGRRAYITLITTDSGYTVTQALYICIQHFPKVNCIICTKSD